MVRRASLVIALCMGSALSNCDDAATTSGAYGGGGHGGAIGVCDAGLTAPTAGQRVGVDEATIEVDLGSCGSLDDLRLSLNGKDITEHLMIDGTLATVSLWQLELDEITAEGNILVLKHSDGGSLGTVDFAVDTEAFWLVRDDYEIPHIYAFSKKALFFGMGWAAAAEKGETIVKEAYVASGRGTEIYGEALAEADYRRRLHRLRELAEETFDQMAPDTQLATASFADGINAYNLDKDMGWRSIDKYMIIAAARTPDNNRAHSTASWEIGYGQLIDELEQMSVENLWEKLHPAVNAKPVIRKNIAPLSASKQRGGPGPGPGASVALPPGARSALLRVMAAEERARPNPTNGSFTWVATNDKTADDNTLVAGIFAFPEGTITTEMHIKGPEYDAIGVIRSWPGLFYGHNRNLTWWLSRTNPDSGDTYKYQVKVDAKGQPLEYLYDGKWLAVRREIIELKVKQGSAFKTAKLPAFYIDRGAFALPVEVFVENDKSYYWAVEEAGKHYVYAFNLAQLHDAEQVTPGLLQMKAKSFDELSEVLSEQHNSIFTTTSVDKDGEVFVLYNGKIPTRDNESTQGLHMSGHWSRPFDGSKAEGAWNGYVDYAHLPLYDSRKHGLPDEGYLLNFGASLNVWVPREDLPLYPRGIVPYKITSGGQPAPTFSGNGWLFGARDYDERLASSKTVDADQMRKMLFNAYCPMIDWYREVLLTAYEKKGHLIAPKYQAEADEIIEVLENSSSEADADNRGVLMYFMWIKNLALETFGDELGSELETYYDNISPAKHGEIYFLLNLIYLPDMQWAPPDEDVSYLSAFVDDLNTGPVETPDEIIVRALQSAIQEVLEDPDPAKVAYFGGTTPRWGALAKEKGYEDVERYGGPRGLGCMEEKDHFYLDGLNTTKTAVKWRPQYKVLWQIDDRGIAAQTIVAHHQSVRDKKTAGSKYDDQGKLYQAGQLKKQHYLFADVWAARSSAEVVKLP